MFVRRLAWATALGLTILTSRPILATEPPRLSLPAVNDNQSLADQIGGHLRQSGLLRGYSIDLAVRDGEVEVSGVVANQPQREEVLRLVQGVPGVQRVRDRMRLAEQANPVVQVQGPALPRLPELGNNAPTSAAPPVAPPPPGAGRPDAGNGNGGIMPEPFAMHRAHPPAFGEMNPPRMPPYAWPSYAPYNNFSRVAYPEAYPWQSFPFIGPVYPFPKVPPGWRSVKLEWDDGYWWYGQVGNKYNWWKLRYW